MRQPSLFLVRPPPLPGESLSSWRQRSAWRNGYTLFPVSDERFRRVDPDLGLHQSELSWLAACHNRSVDEIVSLTLLSQIGKFVDHLASRSQPDWWLRARQGSEARPFGPMFCPVCLGSDVIPYFRLAWRFGFVTQCIDHGCQLVDQCPACLYPPWPGASGVKDQRAANCRSLRACWHCGFDLSKVAAPPVQNGTTALLLEGLRHGSMPCGSQTMPIAEVLHALRGICQLFLRNRARQKILLSKTSWVVFVEGMSDDAKSAISVDYLCVEDRAYLLKGSWTILANWPESFVEFAQKTGVSRAHFNGTQVLQPEWMNQTIDERLALQNRTVTSEKIAKTIAEISCENHGRPSKTAVRQRLNWSGDRGLDDFFPNRTDASAAEHNIFCQECHAEINRQSEFKRSHRHALIDIAAILFCIYETQTIEAACSHSVGELTHQLERHASDGSNNSPMTGLLQGVLSGLKLIPSVFYVALSPSPRQVRKRLVQLMSGMDCELARDVSVFRS